jgi:hypothetical protein
MGQNGGQIPTLAHSAPPPFEFIKLDPESNRKIQRPRSEQNLYRKWEQNLDRRMEKDHRGLMPQDPKNRR